VGREAPTFTLNDLNGSNVSLPDLLAGSKPVILLFTHPECGPCTALLPEASVWQREQAAHFRLALISQCKVKENRIKMKEHALSTVLIQQEQEVSAKYQAYGTPSAVLVRPDGTIGSSVAAGAEAIRTLVASAINESMASLVSISVSDGDMAPPLVYPDLDGRMFPLAELRGSPSILLFWNPGCGFCQQMLPDVKAWENHASKHGARLLVISAGSVEDNRKLGLRSTIVLDQNFSAGKAFGVGGTPSGLRLDSEGRVASKIKVGRQEIIDALLPAFAAAALNR
jgi:peroxiredoxin